MVKQLLDAGADVHAGVVCALHFAVCDGHLTIVRCCETEVQNFMLIPADALSTAAMMGHEHVVHCCTISLRPFLAGVHR